jgi:hypothetical protein
LVRRSPGPKPIADVRHTKENGLADERASPLHLAKRCGHKTDKPNTLVDLFDADGLSGKDGVEINFFVTKVDCGRNA